MHGLVMQTVCCYNALAENLFHPAAGFDRDAVNELVARLIPVAMLLPCVGTAFAEVLVQVAAQRNIQKLHATTDSQRGNPFLCGPTRQCQLQCIKGRTCFAQECMRLLLVVARIYIGSTREQETIQAGKKRL